jgi:secreted PhoX family phosphatase
LDETTGLPLLQLPKGFTYSSFGWQGDLMSNGKPCPGRHDGMGVIASQNNTKDADIVLVRNHEVGFSEPGNFIEADGIYDRDTRTAADQSLSGGGTTSLLFRNGKWISMVPSLGGTQLNCAGGVTPWGTWLTCEEIGFDLTSSSGKKHGYVFEVHADPGKTSGQPIIGMGRFAHEAAAVDLHTGIVYMTEDSAGKSGFYRYIPNVAKGSYGSLAKGGVLQMAKVKDIHNANLAAVPVDAIYPLEWITISEPDRNRGDAIGPSGIRIVNASGPFVQGWKEGAARMNRGEGIWYFQGKLYVMDTSGGFASRGSIWELDLKRQTIKSIYSSPHALVGNMGDNLTVSPGGGLLLCEDANEKTIDSFGMGQRLMGLTAEGSAYIFAKNNVSLNPDDVKKAGKTANALGDHRNQEFCGACFDPAGHFLFVNIQTPGITFAITGPWGNGPLRS